jgi:hypothetical protein
MCRLSWNPGASASWNAQGLSRPVQRLLYLLPLINHKHILLCFFFPVCTVMAAGSGLERKTSLSVFQMPGNGKLDTVQYCNFLGFVVPLGLQFRTQNLWPRRWEQVCRACGKTSCRRASYGCYQNVRKWRDVPFKIFVARTGVGMRLWHGAVNWYCLYHHLCESEEEVCFEISSGVRMRWRIVRGVGGMIR